MVYSNKYYLIPDISNLCWHSFFVSLAIICQLYWYFRIKSCFYFLHYFHFEFHWSELFIISFLVLALGSFCPYFYDFINGELILLVRHLLFYKLSMLYIALEVFYLHSTYFDSTCIFNLFQCNFFKAYLRLPLWSTDYFEVCYLISKYLEFSSCFSIINF